MSISEVTQLKLERYTGYDFEISYHEKTRLNEPNIKITIKKSLALPMFDDPSSSAEEEDDEEEKKTEKKRKMSLPDKKALDIAYEIIQGVYSRDPDIVKCRVKSNLIYSISDAGIDKISSDIVLVGNATRKIIDDASDEDDSLDIPGLE